MTHKQHTNFGYKILTAIVLIIGIMQVFSAKGFYDPFPQPPEFNPSPDDTSKFPEQPYENVNKQKQPIELQDPENLQKEVEYDPDEDRFYFNQKVGDRNVRNPFYMDGDEYFKYRTKRDENEYFRQRLEALSMFNQKPTLPSLSKDGVFDRLFGGDKIEITPQGNLDLTFGGNWQNMKNPNMIQSQQKWGIFDFDMNMNVNLIAKIGEKMKLNISNSTLSSFGEQNTKKIGYTGKEDEIIKTIEAGNVSFPLNSALLSGPLSLFGLKTQLQFGKLFVTGVLSQQKSQRKTINIQGGAQTTEFEIKADDYEENKNFFLSQYFYENYEKALERLPIINSQITINEVQVWITNRTGATQGVRDILAFMDLGEKNPYVPTLLDPNVNNNFPENRANRLYNLLMQTPEMRTQATATQGALGLGLQDNIDFQRSTMRQLNQSEFSFEPQLGYINLNTQTNPDDILAVAFRYTLNGKVYQVGEFAEDFPPDSTNQKVIFLKLLKGGTSGRPQLPIWKLMMKNVYSIGYGGQITAQDFKLNVLYQDPGGGDKRYLPDGPNAGVPLITLLNLDQLNRQLDPSPDGVFDYIEGVTINSRMGKIIFPVLEPFNDGLKHALGGDPRLEKRYLYPMLYDSTKSIARQFQQNNRFLIKGSYKGSSGSEIRLGFNIPEGSVVVTAGGQRLVEGTDYQVNYGSGSVTILNQGVLSSGIPISISFEDNAMFSFVQQNFWGLRFDYYLNNHLTLGSTLMRLTERPFSEKVLLGDDPIKNTVLGFDANYQNEFPWLTRTLDKLPFISTSAPSLISLSGEVAGIFPGHQRFINAIDPEGSAFIDDFEGSNSYTDLRFPPTTWSLASTPAGAIDRNGQHLFPEAANSDVSNSKNRAKIAWYMLEPSLVDGYSETPANIKKDTAAQSYWRLVQQPDLFPQRNLPTGQNYLPTFDLSYYPNQRGPYNFDADANIINPQNGHFTNPRDRFGGIQRAIENNNSDFEASNVEYITMWLLDPFLYNPNNSGDLYINLGNVSEDVMKDGRLAFENGIPYPKDVSKLDLTPWGYVPRFQQQITRSFDNDPAARAVQDVGYDGLNDEEERVIFKSFLDAIQASVSPEVFAAIEQDPASDNYHHFRGHEYDQAELSAIERYKHFNNPSGNSPVTDASSTFTNSGTTLPESEDINKDNTLNETESYFQYRISLRYNMNVGEQNIVDKKVINVKQKDGRMEEEIWYQIKIPIREYDHAVGGISDFRSIRFMRMFLSGFQDSTVLRFAQLQLDRNNWRKYLFSLTNPGENIPEEDQLTTSFSVSSVSLEENYNKIPVPYRMPPGVQRQVSPGGITGQNLQQDEQSMSFQICGLKDGDARAAFKETTIDMRQNKYLRMFVHAESVPNEPIVNNGDVKAFIRIGSDFINNYYEYQIPLNITANGSTLPDDIWPKENRMDIDLERLIEIKNTRNRQGIATYLPYVVDEGQGRKVVVVGNPNLGDVKNVMLGVVNPKKTLDNPADDGQRKCVEVWFDELRLAGFDEKPGYAASGQANIQLADLGNVHVGASMHTDGYGNIDQKSNERFKDNFHTFDISTNLNLGKFLPKKAGVQLPVYAAYTQMVSNPKYNPFDKDVLLKEQLNQYQNAQQIDSVQKMAQDYNSITSVNLNNIRYLGNPEKQPKKIMPWSLRNFDFSYLFNNNYKRNPLLERDELTEQKLNINYAYSLKTRPIEPFKKMLFKKKSKWWAPIKDFNFTYLPSSFSVRNELHRLFGETQVRNVDGGPYEMPATYYKNFTWERNYTLRWELTKSLSFNYSGLNQSRIDEPEGRINTPEKRDSLWRNFAKMGRNTYFNQSFRADYSLPTKKIPILDWTTINVSYASTFNWTAASRLAMEQGNIMANTQMRSLNGEFSFTQLYNKSRWLRAINARSTPINNTINKNRDKDGKVEPSVSLPDKIKDSRATQVPPKPQKKEITEDMVKGKDTLSPQMVRKELRKLKKAERKKHRAEMIAWRARKNRILPEVSPGLKVVGRLATMLKRVSVNYSDNSGTVLPGFMDSTQFLGINARHGNNWTNFAFGFQPDENWINRQAELNRMSRDSIFNGQIQQTFSQTVNINASVEPFPDFRIDFSWSQQFSKNYSESFKFDWNDETFHHYSPYSMGTFSASYVGFKTLFTPSYANKPSQLFDNFMNYRELISRRLGLQNPYTNGLPDPEDPNYMKGYTAYAQDVLIPAFLAAYGGRDVNNISLIKNENNGIRSNPFRGYIAMPNWKINYNGLAKIPAVSNYLTNFTFSHSYIGNLSMNSFVSSFYYQDLLGLGFPSFIDSNSHNFVPFFSVPNITITENLGPFIGFDAAFKNGLSLSMKFNKNRMLSLSLVDFQVSETRSTEWIFGGGWRVKGLTLPIEIFGVRRLQNDVNFKLDVGFRNDLTTNSYLAQYYVVPTRGQKVITINPAIDYIINDNLQIRFYYERNQTIPALSTSYPITTTRGGLMLRFMFNGQ